MIDNGDITKKDLGIKRFALKQIWFEKIQQNLIASLREL